MHILIFRWDLKYQIFSPFWKGSLSLKVFQDDTCKKTEEEPQKQDHFLIWNQPEKTKKTDTVHVIYNKKNVICPALSSQVYAMKKMANKSVNIFANSRTLRWKKLFFVGRGESNKIIIW